MKLIGLVSVLVSLYIIRAKAAEIECGVNAVQLDDNIVHKFKKNTFFNFCFITSEMAITTNFPAYREFSTLDYFLNIENRTMEIRSYVVNRARLSESTYQWQNTDKADVHDTLAIFELKEESDFGMLYLVPDEHESQKFRTKYKHVKHLLQDRFKFALICVTPNVFIFQACDKSYAWVQITDDKYFRDPKLNFRLIDEEILDLMKNLSIPGQMVEPFDYRREFVPRLLQN